MIPKTKCRVGICLTLLIFNLSFIWGNSLMPAPISAAFSGWVQEVLAALFHMGDSVPAEGHGLLRKLAHFTEFMSLGLILSWLFAMLGKNFRLPLFCGFLAACVDETIQCFVPGRGPSFWDVCIDTCGVLLAVLLFRLGLNIHQKRKLLEDTKL